MNSAIHIVSYSSGTVDNNITWSRYLYSNGWQRIFYYFLSAGYSGIITHPYPFKYRPYFAVGIASDRSGSSYTRETSIQNNSTTSFSVANFSAGSDVSGQGGCVIFIQIAQKNIKNLI